MSVSLTASNTRAALNSGEGQQVLAVAAIKSAAQSEQAIAALVEQTAANLKALAPTGQGQNVDRSA